MIFDVEEFMEKVKARLADDTAGINVEIANINTERSTSDVSRYGYHIALDSLALDGAIFYFWQKGVIDYNPWIEIYPDEHITNEDDIELVRIIVQLNFTDNGDGLAPERKLLRYAKAVRRCLIKKRFSGYFSSCSISTLGYDAIEEDISDGSESKYQYSAKVAISGQLFNE